MQTLTRLVQYTGQQLFWESEMLQNAKCVGSISDTEAPSFVYLAWGVVNSVDSSQSSHPLFGHRESSGGTKISTNARVSVPIMIWTIRLLRFSGEKCDTSGFKLWPNCAKSQNCCKITLKPPEFSHFLKKVRQKWLKESGWNEISRLRSQCSL